MIETRRLGSGMPLLLDPMGGTKTVSIGFWFPFGSRHESPGERGASHFLEHMLFKGTARRGAADIARTIDTLGGYLNAFTERENLCVYCSLPAQDYQVALDVLCDMCFASIFDDKEFKKEKQVILNEILSYRDDAEENSFDEFLKLIWPDHELSRPITGEEGDLEGLNRDELFRFYENRVSLADTLVCAAGAFDPSVFVNALERALESTLEGRLGQGLDQAYRAPRLYVGSKPQFRAQKTNRRAPTSQIINYMAQDMEREDGIGAFYAHAIFNCAFGDSMASRLFQSLREDAALCYSVSSFFSESSDALLFTINGGTNRAQHQDYLRLLEAEIVRLKLGLGQREIDDARHHIEGSMIMAEADTENRMKRLARQFYEGGLVYEVGEAQEILRRVPDAEVQRIACDKIELGRMACFSYGDIGRRRWIR